MRSGAGLGLNPVPHAEFFSVSKGSFWPLVAALEATQSTAIRQCLDCYDEAPSVRCLSFRQMFSSPASTDSSSPSPHPSCSSSSDGSSTMTSPLPSPGSWHTTRQLSDVVVIDSPSRSRHSMAASSRADPLRTVGQHLAVFCLLRRCCPVVKSDAHGSQCQCNRLVRWVQLRNRNQGGQMSIHFK